MRIEPVSSVPSPTSPPRKAGGKRRMFWSVLLTFVVVVLLLIVGAIWYANTPQFARFIRGKIIGQLEQTTGGRVDVGTFQWSLLHLDFVLNNLTIHGLEGPGQLPYVHVDRIYVRAKIISLFGRNFGLNYF